MCTKRGIATTAMADAFAFRITNIVYGDDGLVTLCGDDGRELVVHKYFLGQYDLHVGDYVIEYPPKILIADREKALKNYLLGILLDDEDEEM